MGGIEITNYIIGCFLLDPKTLDEIAAEVTPEMLSPPVAASALRAALELKEAGKEENNVVFLRDRMAADGFNPTEATQYLIGCLEITSTTANLSEYLALAKSEVRKKELEKIAEGISLRLASGESADLVAGEAVSAIGALGGGREKIATVSSPEALVSWGKWYMSLADNPDKAFCRTGFQSIDAQLGGGMVNGNVYIIAGRPGMGKTTVALNIAERMAREKPVLFFSLEMTAMQLTAKRIASIAGLNSNELITGRLGAEDTKAAFKAADRLMSSKLTVTDEKLDVADMLRAARGIDRLGCIVIDHLSAFPYREGNFTERDRMTRLSGEIADMAKRLGVPVLLLCQLNRKNTDRSDKRPTMADLRESGAIEQDAAGVMLLHRNGYYDKSEERPDSEPIEIIVDKNRFGGTGTVKLSWLGSAGRIADYMREVT